MDNPADRRLDLPRVQRDLPAEIRVGKRTHPCLLENASPNGAGLRANANLLLPQQFDLVIGTAVIPVVMVWRKADRIGVCFGPTWRATPQVRHMLMGVPPRS